MSTITDKDKHKEMIQIAVLEAIEDFNDTLNKIEFDGLIMLYIESTLE